MMVVFCLIVLGSGYLMVTLLAAYGAAVFAGGPIPLFSKLAADAARLPGADGWHTVFDVTGTLGSIPSVAIALAVLFVPFFFAGYGIRLRIAHDRGQVERRRRDEEIARDEEVRERT